MNNDTTLTLNDLHEFAEAFRRGLETPALGDVAHPRDVTALHSDHVVEDGSCRLRLWDLVDGRTGAQTDDGPIFYCD